MQPRNAGEVADRYVDGLARLDPGAARAIGAPVQGLWAPVGPEAVQAVADLARGTLVALGDLPPEQESSGGGPHLAHALTERLGSDLALHDAGFTGGLVAPLASPAHMVMMGLESAVDDSVDAVVEGLTEVPAALQDYTERLAATSAAGYTVPALQSRTLAGQLRRWADAEGDDRLGALLPDDLDEVTQQVLDRARDSCRELADWLEQVHATRGRTQDAVGEELYRITSGAFLGTQVDLEETYAYGWSRLAELTREAEAIAADLGCAGVAEAEALLDADEGGRVRVGPELVRWVEGRMERAHHLLDGTIFDVPAGRPCGAVLAAPGSGSIYYSPPDPAGTRGGRVVWSTPTGATTVPTWREVSTVHHEGLPGHHLQHVVTASIEGLHPWQRHLCHVHGYAEGWAHYTEGRAHAWGLLQHPGERLGVVLAQRWRAARIVIDMGLHLGYPIPAGNGFTDATGWSIDVGVDVLTQAAGCDRETATFEVIRYLGWPGQALAFSTGARLWEEARHAALASGRFTERSFHEHALGLGPMGMAPLRHGLAEMSHA